MRAEASGRRRPERVGAGVSELSLGVRFSAIARAVRWPPAFWWAPGWNYFGRVRFGVRMCGSRLIWLVPFWLPCVAGRNL